MRDYIHINDYVAFGRQLITTGDLDPIYVMLQAANLPRDILDPWLVAYWCYYNASTCSRIVEAPDFWAAMHKANRENWPHGFERRHFRGEAATKAIEELRIFHSPSNLIAYLGGPDPHTFRPSAPLTFERVSQRVQTFYLFGPWIAWKVADMLERVLHVPIDFSNASLAIYRDPRAGAALLATGDWDTPITDAQLNGVVTQLLHDFSDMTAPPSRDRPINIQEVETILCKFKAHQKGFYPINNDTHEVAKGLREHPSALGNQLLEALLRSTPSQDIIDVSTTPEAVHG